MIRFLLKVAVQRLLGAVPGGPAAYDWAQRGLTRSVAPTDDALREQRGRAEAVLALLHDALPGVEIAELGPHLDIGAGWIPMIPLALRQHGIQRHWLVDIRRLLRPEPAIAAGRWLDDRRGPLPALSPPREATPAALEQWFDRLAIRDLSPAFPPYDIATGSVGLVTCWQVLQYPPREAVRAIHEEAARVLRPGGLYVAAIRLEDQYAAGDPALPRFHFLRYGGAAWKRWFDNRFAPMNRLRPSDHAGLLDGLPFERLVWRVDGGGPAELAELARCRPHPEFAAYAPEDLAAIGLAFVLRRSA